MDAENIRILSVDWYFDGAGQSTQELEYMIGIQHRIAMESVQDFLKLFSPSTVYKRSLG